MATLPELRQVAFISGTLVTTSDVSAINDENDATYIESNAGNGIDGQWRYSLDSVPADFGSMDSFTIHLRAHLSATGDDTWNIRAFIADSAGNAISGIPAYQLVDATATNDFTFTPTLPATNTKVAWNDAHIIIDYQNIKNMAADGNVVRVTRSSITGTYSIAVPTSTGDIASNLPSLTQVASGTHEPPLPGTYTGDIDQTLPSLTQAGSGLGSANPDALQFIGAVSGVTDGADASIIVPAHASTETGDFLVALATHGVGGATGQNLLADGWTKHDQVQLPGGFDYVAAVFTKLSEGEVDYTFYTEGGETERWAVGVMAFRGTSGIDAISGTFLTGDSTTLTCESVDTTVVDTMIIRLGSQDDGGGIHSLTGYDEAFHNEAVSGAIISGFYATQSLAGPTGTVDINSTLSDVWATFTLALAPVEAEPDTTAPTITAGPTATNIASTTTNIEWTTDEPSDSEVEYELASLASGWGMGFTSGFSPVAAPSEFIGSIDQTLPSLSQGASGSFTKPTDTGDITSTLPSFGQSASGAFAKPTDTGDITSALPSLTQVAEGVVTKPSYIGSAESTLPAFAQSASGATAVPVDVGDISSTLPSLTQNAGGTTSRPSLAGDIASTLPAFEQSASGGFAQPVDTGDIASVLPGLTQQATGSIERPVGTGEIASALPTLQQSATGGTAAPVDSGDIAQTLPALQQSASGSFVDANAPVITSGPTATNVTANSTTIEWTTDESSDSEVEYLAIQAGDINSTLPIFEQSSSGSVSQPTDVGDISSTLPSFDQFAEGTVTRPIDVGDITSVLPLVQQSASGSVTTPIDVGDITSVLPTLGQTATGSFTEPGEVRITSTLPVFEQSASGTITAPAAMPDPGYLYIHPVTDKQRVNITPPNDKQVYVITVPTDDMYLDITSPTDKQAVTIVETDKRTLIVEESDANLVDRS